MSHKQDDGNEHTHGGGRQKARKLSIEWFTRWFYPFGRAVNPFVASLHISQWYLESLIPFHVPIIMYFVLANFSIFFVTSLYNTLP